MPLHIELDLPVGQMYYGARYYDPWGGGALDSIYNTRLRKPTL